MKKMDKRELIITATCDLIAENGLQATPISMVAKEACCGAGTIYRYFETKEALIEDVYLTLMERFSDACLKGVDENASVREQLNTVWLNLYHYMREVPRDALLLDQLSVAPAIRGELQEQGKRRLKEKIDPLFARGREEGIIKDIPDDVLGVFVYGGISTLLRTDRNAPCAVPTEVTDDMLLSICWGAIEKRD